MNRVARVAAVLALFVLIGVAGAADNPEAGRLLVRWDGEVKLELRKGAPKDGYVADAATWEKLWKAYRPGEKVPRVDFGASVVLVAVNTDPNTISITAILDDKGDLKVGAASTLIGSENPVTTCKYQFALVPRAGVKTINGKPIGGK